MLQPSDRLPLPWRVTFGGGSTGLTEATRFACSQEVMSDSFSGQGENNRVPPPWKATLGEEAVFAEVARVECRQAAMPNTFSGQTEKTTVN